MKVYLAADHGGFLLKNTLVEYVRSLGHEAEDCGAHTLDPEDDYPAIIAIAGRTLAADVAAGRESRAIVLGRSGQGEAIVMNRFPGVRCALYHGGNMNMVRQTRAHNDVNALSLGADFLSEAEASEAARTFLESSFSGEEKHARRNNSFDTLFDFWNKKKQEAESTTRAVFFKEGDIFYARLGQNVGFEENGTGATFTRPVLVVRKFNPQVFFAVALTTRGKDHPLYMSLGDVGGRENFAILSQARLLDGKRLERKLGRIPVQQLDAIRAALATTLLYKNSTPPLSRG